MNAMGIKHMADWIEKEKITLSELESMMLTLAYSDRVLLLKELARRAAA